MAETTLEYSRASLWKRCFAFLFDFLCAALLATSLSAGGEAVLQNAPSFSAANQTMQQIEIASGLYVVDGSSTKSISTAYAISSAYSPDEETYQTTDDRFETALTSFYNNETFFAPGVGADLYLNLKVGDNALSYDDGSPYWHYEKNEKGETKLLPSVAASKLYDFYIKVIDEDAIPRISAERSDYVDASKTIFWSTFGLIYGLSALSLFLFFVLIPLFFKRGYQTFGKKLYKLSLINASAVNPTPGQYWARSCLLFFVEFVLSSLSFGIPLIVSFTMMMTRSDEQSFHDYMAGTYVVDTSVDTVYLSKEEYFSKTKTLQNFELKDAEKIVKKP
jgi:uncharacterized RDD family membrane protein YckC